MKKLTLCVLLMALSLSACASASAQPADLDSIVQATLQALTAQAEVPALPAATSAKLPASITGGIAGQVNAGADDVVAFDVNSEESYLLNVPDGATSYQIDDIPPGEYVVIAFHGMGPFAAPFPQAYSKYVTCGMTENCADHTPIPVTVNAGQVTQGVDAVDNWGNPDLNLYLQQYLDIAGVAPTVEAGRSILKLGGAVTGTLSYPSEFIPAMAVVAYRVGGGPTDYYYILTDQGDSTYTIAGMVNGEYYVVAYILNDPSLAGGYTQAVPCGLTVSCTDHSLIPIPVANGGAADQINPQDWYAPPGTFPAFPLP